MAKTIAVMDYVYSELVKHKRPGESFSKELLRFIGKKGHISDLGGSWKISEGEAKEIQRRLTDLRARATRKTLFEKVGLP